MVGARGEGGGRGELFINLDLKLKMLTGNDFFFQNRTKEASKIGATRREGRKRRHIFLGDELRGGREAGGRAGEGGGTEKAPSAFWGPLAVVAEAGVVGVGDEDGGEVEDEMEVGSNECDSVVFF